ncbi:acyl-CoA N-acyltransferase [Annulohypoxylon truncatum]|uniref:acyl-CoA N-acyltransferase n=1 Tax=Annulohypoxylon truncatum TaxID=327061 RepID=UPI00200837C7|nr:acyl-CoA N-acyltransferase [Annulohypoxylon truncatum]KAI1207634.1 acyl-CoA N-acyltransferase [Annulohypoxylon truncatum]
MAPQKRKRPHDNDEPPPPPPPPRRATRQHPDEQPEPERQLRSGRVRTVRAGAIEKPAPAEAPVARGAARGDASKAPRRPGRPPTKRVAEEKVRVLKENVRPAGYDGVDEEEEEEEIEEVELLRRTPSPTPPPTEPTQTRPPKPSLQQQLQQSRAAQSASADKMSTPKRPSSSADKLSKPPPTPRSDRNIDKVVLGDICFKAWYPSYYGKEVLGDISNTNNANAGGKDRQGSKDRDGGGKIGGRIGGGKRNPPPMLDRLYVCPCCFKYSRELVMWWEHVRCCERTFRMPGTKVYTHPKGKRTVRTTVAGAASGSVEKGRGRGRKRSDADASTGVSAIVEKVVMDEGEWSVWEVDGEKDRLFCQNLSLFAKLFLDNKSVFFDVTGFNYFLLVYTPPQPSDAQPPPPLANRDLNESPPQSRSSTHPSDPDKQQQALPGSRPQVVGFFSKEKLSWDNNNLACILVFPPWQRKGLGALLMGVSYEISRREGILGGPEKPISELGRKGYKRFWAGEIARWLLGLDLSKPVKNDGEEGEGEEGVDKEEGSASEKGREGEYLISVDQCSKATWIVPEDCLAVLKEMGVVEDAGPGPADAVGESAEHGGGSGGGASDEEAEAAEPKEEAKAVPRVRLDKEAVRRWVEDNKIDLTKTCDPDGFVEGYAIGKGEDEEVDEV